MLMELESNLKMNSMLGLIFGCNIKSLTISKLFFSMAKNKAVFWKWKRILWYIKIRISSNTIRIMLLKLSYLELYLNNNLWMVLNGAFKIELIYFKANRIKMIWNCIQIFGKNSIKIFWH